MTVALAIEYRGRTVDSYCAVLTLQARDMRSAESFGVDVQDVSNGATCRSGKFQVAEIFRMREDVPLLGLGYVAYTH